MAENDSIFIYSQESAHIIKLSYDTMRRYFLINGSKVRIAIGRNLKDSQEIKQQYWGFKLNLHGVSSDDLFSWHPNSPLNLYSCFIALLMEFHSKATKSLKLQNEEKDFTIILNDSIIQGIKLEDIDNYESSINDKTEKKKYLEEYLEVFQEVSVMILKMNHN